MNDYTPLKLSITTTYVPSIITGEWSVIAGNYLIARIQLNEHDGTFSWFPYKTITWKPVDEYETHNTLRQCMDRITRQWKDYVLAYEAKLNPPPPPRKPLFQSMHKNSLLSYINTLKESSVYCNEWNEEQQGFVRMFEKFIKEKT